MYQLLYHPRTLKFLKKISRKEARRVVEKISLLQNNPFSQKLDIKKLATTKESFRLRVGQLRIIYEINETKKTIYVHEIDFRGNVY